MRGCKGYEGCGGVDCGIVDLTHPPLRVPLLGGDLDPPGYEGRSSYQLSTINYQLSNMKTSILTCLNPLTGILLLASIITALPAFANPDLNYNGANIYKDSKGMVYKVSNTDVSVGYGGVQVSKSIWSDACGFSRISLGKSSNIPSAVTFNGSSDTVNSISRIYTPGYKCTNGVAKWDVVPPTSVSKVITGSGSSGGATGVVIYYPPTRTGGASKQSLVTYSANLTRNTKPTCGFVVVNPAANSQRQTSTMLSFDGAAIDVASLPVNPAPPDCMKGKLFTSAASAAVGGNAMYRTDKSVYVTGQTPGSINVVKYDALRSRSFKTTGTCGLFKIGFTKESPVSIKIGTTTFDPTTVVSTAVDSCSSTGLAAMTANTLYKNGGYFYYKLTDLSKTAVLVETPYLTSKNIPVNACGFAIIPSLNTAEGFTVGDKLIINGSAPYSVSTLPLVTTTPICKNGAIYTSAP